MPPTSADAARQLPQGQRLGPYEVVSRIGAGGMGEVYEARDSRLGRRVAVKVIRSDVATDPDRLKRFEREARAVAALSHPNICTVFDVGREETPRGPVDYMVVEYLEGVDLAVRLKKGPLPTDDLLKAGAEIAAALDSAHRAGIVHRDVKPSNIVLTRTGAKLLDFGLARLRSNPATSDSDGSAVTEAARSDTLTDAGVVVGTYPYMAPELLEGKPADARADLFALGAVLYEMATGQRAFNGSTPASLAAAILTSEPPPLTTLRPVAPLALERLVRNLLAKDPDARVQTAHDVALRLRDIEQDSGSGGGGLRRRARTMALWTLAALACALALFAVWRWQRPQAAPLPPQRLVQLTTLRHELFGPTFSPDGQQVAFCWTGEKGDNWDIYVKRVDSPEVLRLTEGPEVDGRMSWSPDGRLIAFDQYPYLFAGAKGRIRVISPLGGASRKVGDLPPEGALSWSPDGRWLATGRHRAPGETRPEDGGLYLVPIEGGEPRVLTRPAPPGDDLDPAFSPDGRRLAYKSCASGYEFEGLQRCGIFVLDLGPDYGPLGVPRRITPPDVSAANPVWTRDGASIVYEDNTGLGKANSAGLFRVDAGGDRPPERIELAGLQARAPAVAPIGNRLAFVRFNREWDLYRFEAGRAEPFLASSAVEADPDYSPDGRRIAFISTRAGGVWELWLANADGTNPMQLAHGPGKFQASPTWSPDGRQIAFDSQGADSHWDIWTVDAEGGAPGQLTRDPGDEQVPIWSRDGRWVYFTSRRSGSAEIWRVPAGGGAEERVTHGGASFSKHESADGRSLLYWREKDEVGTLVAHPLDGGPEQTLVDCAKDWNDNFRVYAAGIYYRSCGEKGQYPIRLLDPATGRSRLIGLLPEDSGAQFAVSPDGKFLLYSTFTSRSPDLMMIENFQ